MNQCCRLPLILTFMFCACRISERKDEILSEESLSPRELNAGVPLNGTLTSVGAASAEFIPDKPVALSGYGGIGRRHLPLLFLSNGNSSFCRNYEKTENPPRIKAAVFNIRDNRGNDNPLVLISLDIVAITNDITYKIHKTLADIFPNNTPSLANTLVVASHTHSGVAGLTNHPLWSSFACDKFNPKLSESYMRLLSQVVKTAASRNEKIITIEQRERDLPSLFRSRFRGMRAATDVSLTSFQTDSGRTPLALAQMAVHPTFYGPNDLVLSADLVSPVETEIKASAGADEVFLLQTTIGNMDADFASDTRHAWARKIADGLKDAAKNQSDSLEISPTAGFIELPSAEVNWAACGASFAESLVSLPILKKLPARLPFASWQFNKTKHLFLAGEWTTNAAAQIQSAISADASAQSKVKLFSLANDYTAYHLTRDDYEKKTMESCQSIYGTSTVDKISDTLSRVLR